MDYTTNASTKSLGNLSTASARKLSDSEIVPVSVLETKKNSGIHKRQVDGRQKLLLSKDSDELVDTDSPLGPRPKVPMYEKKRQEAMEQNKKAAKKLVIVLFTSLIFIVIEILGGYYADSIAIMSDAAHIASDVIGFGISICALRMAHRKADSTYTFGYHRVEIIGAFCSIFTIWIMTVWLLYEATQRFFNPPEIMGGIMLSIAVLSFFFNLIQIKILHSGEGGHVHAGG